ncbi:hypothetical protein GCM10012285_41890 [Streptomyces kronopolitis]|uniref:Uncharacterized protein n=1 Tax=Streptomyces kronopolitis TaxID=1612435 RepID=A0ABQ2JQ10_9ACTN|nr:hypothetical protein GCM10012285_41890 [Streptomyces kronopolitis]
MANLFPGRTAGTLVLYRSPQQFFGLVDKGAGLLDELTGARLKTCLRG